MSQWEKWTWFTIGNGSHSGWASRGRAAGSYIFVPCATQMGHRSAHRAEFKKRKKGGSFILLGPLLLLWIIQIIERAHTLLNCVVVVVGKEKQQKHGPDGWDEAPLNLFGRFSAGRGRPIDGPDRTRPAAANGPRSLISLQYGAHQNILDFIRWACYSAHNNFRIIKRRRRKFLETRRSILSIKSLTNSDHDSRAFKKSSILTITQVHLTHSKIFIN